MRKSIILIVGIWISFTANLCAQDAEYSKQQTIYRMALQYNDYAVARGALYNMLAIRPSNKDLLDTLSLLYYEQQLYVSSAITAQESAKNNPSNLLALEIAANSFEKIGLNDKALEHYKLLYSKNSDLSTLYKIAFFQYRMQRFSEALSSADNIINDPKSQELEMVFGKKDQSTQMVSMIAATYRLKGLIAYEKKETENALQYFRKALEYAPEFEIVTDAIKQLQN